MFAAVPPVFAQNSDVVWGVSCCCGGVVTLIFALIAYHFLKDFEYGTPRTTPSVDEIAEELPRKVSVTFRGEKVPEWKANPREQATKAVAKFLSYTDNWFDPKYLHEVADEAFRLVKDAIKDQTVQGVERRLTKDCLDELRAEIKKLRKEREARVFDKLLVTNVQVVQVEAPKGKDNHTFTALITGKSRDYIVDDETGETVRGDKRVYLYQEFYTFRRSEKRWLVELIRPSIDVDAVLGAKNVLAPIDFEEFAKDADPEHLKHVTPRG
ncbi:MAG TPA: TIM44-like domain-containing protein [Gemmataceae bacterium]|jgi:predicted lipid-binding transport protein (Tim44 family)|nr:TIM44-like domain-containing protein [Gemmataceae bacterium]